MTHLLKITIILFSTLACAILPIYGKPSGGKQSDDSAVKIIGGVPASPGEFPFMVSLQTKGRNGPNNTHICGATIYNMSRLITAATCVLSGVARNFVITAGAYTLDDAINGLQQYRDIQQITFHPDFEELSETAHDDIAVLDLWAPLETTTTVQPLPFARRTQQYSGQCEIAGWGAAVYQGLVADNLMKGNVTIHSKSYCSLAYPGEFREDRQLCANGINEQGRLVDSCTGDTGGPLICHNDDGSPYLAGISSWGHMCGSISQPGVYMEVSKYKSWLESVAWENPNPPTTPPPTTTTKKPSPGVPGYASDDDGFVLKPVIPSCGL